MGGKESTLNEPAEVPLCTECDTPAGKEAPPEPVPEHVPGLKNYSNSCFMNATIQLLYHSSSFRRCITEHQEKTKDDDDGLLPALNKLFVSMDSSKKVYGPSSFVSRVRELYMYPKDVHQDAHEFLCSMLNTLIDEQRALLKCEGDTLSPIQQLLEGSMSSKFSCIDCESTLSRGESFHHLSLEIEQNTSLVSCLSNFFSPEFLCGTDKFKCDACCTSVCGRKSFHISKTPELLFVQLKRFCYSPETNSRKKLAHRVSVPQLLGVLHNNGEGERTTQYRLKGFVVHHGMNLSYGHYYACIRGEDDQWRVFDDDTVRTIPVRDVNRYFGLPCPTTGSTATAYVILYERCK